MVEEPEYSPKDFQYWISMLAGKSSQINGRLIGISSIIDDLAYLKQIITTLKENLNQFNDVFKLLMNTPATQLPTSR